MKRVFATCLLSLCSAHAAERPPTPPAPFILKGACPFECCIYREWDVKAETRLYEQPDATSKLVGAVKVGEKVDGLTGEVHTTPVRFIVKQPYQSYKPGDVIWVYSYQGEGYFQVLRNGELVSEDLSFSPYGSTGGTRCQEAGCWGTLERELPSVWWVKIRSKTGLVGWSDKPGNFGNKDACG